MKKPALFAVIVTALVGIWALTGMAQERTRSEKTQAPERSAGRDRGSRREKTEKGEQVTIEKEFTAASLERVQANVVIGTVRVIAENTDTVQVKAVRKAERGTAEERRRWLEETRVEFTQKNGVLTIKDIIPESLNRNRDKKENDRTELSVELLLEIHLSARQALDALSVVGNVEVSGKTGDLKLNSTAGNIELDNVDASGKNVELHTTAGDVVCAGRVGNLKVGAQAGNIRLRALECVGAQAEITCMAGQIEAVFRRLPSQRLKVESHAGEVKLTLPAKAQANMDVRTTLGSIRSAWNLGSPSEKDGLGDRLTGAVNGGGTKVEVRVAIGEVQLEKAAQ